MCSIYLRRCFLELLVAIAEDETKLKTIDSLYGMEGSIDSFAAVVLADNVTT